MMRRTETHRRQRRFSHLRLALTVGLVAIPANAALGQGLGPDLAEVMASRHDPSNPASKVDGDLILARASLRRQRVAAERLRGRLGSPVWRGTAMTRVDAAGRVRVYIHVTTLDVLDELVKMGAEVEVVDAPTRTIQAWISPERLELVAARDEVVRIRPPAPPAINRGSRLSEGVAITGVEALHAKGIDGTGVKVGVISDGIAGYTDSQASGDLPPVVTAASISWSGDFEGAWGRDYGGSEGTAMLEIIHDLAPGAELFFCNHDTSLNMARSIKQLAETYGCDVVIDDIVWYDQPYFEEGTIALAAQAVADSGTVYCSAAGNFAEEHYQGVFVDSGTELSYDFASDAHDFGGGDTTIEYFAFPGGTVEVYMQWNTPFYSPAVDLDLGLFDEFNNLLAFSANMQGCSTDQPSGIAFEGLAYTNETDDFAVYSLRVSRHCPADVSPEFELYTRSGWQMEHIVQGDSSFGQATMPGVISCAAIGAEEAAEGTVEYFSSQGPSRIYTGAVGADGLLTGLEERAKPDISGIDGVAVTGNGGFSRQFYGTSAAAPHVGACAALLMQARPEWTGAQIRAALLENAMDVNSTGFDYVTGAGLVDPVTAIEMANDPPVALDDAIDTNEDAAIATNPLRNDLDPDGDALTVVSFTPPNFGTVAQMSSGTFIYTPVDDYHGPDAFTYTIQDARGLTASATVTISVTPGNDAPVAVDDVARTTEGEAVTIPVLDNDFDIDGDTLVSLSVVPPAHGVARINADLTLTYTPEPDFSGVERFAYKIGDQYGGIATAEVTITVIPGLKTLEAADTTLAPRACGVGVISLPVALLQVVGFLALRGRRTVRE